MNQSPVHPIIDWCMKHFYYCIIIAILAYGVFGGFPKCSDPNDKIIKELEIKLKISEKKRAILEIKNDSLKIVADSLAAGILKSKTKTKNIIEKRDKTNLTIMGLPDNELLSTFSEFDTRSNKDK